MQTNDAENTARRVIPIRVEGSSGLAAGQEAAVQDACARLGGLPGNLLPVLHAVQGALGYVPPAALPVIARQLNLSVAEVHGCMSFYHYFRATSGGRHVLHLCRAEACQAQGAAALEAQAKQLLGVDFHGTTADGAIRLEPVYCLGNCALGPSLMLDTRLEGRVTAARLEALLAECRGTP